MKEYLENRIAYLMKLEREELEELDHLERGIKRELKWEFIHEIGARKNELQNAVKFMQSAQLQQHSVMQAEGSDGVSGAAVGIGGWVRGVRDWEEDFAHENGNYFNKCVRCNNMFMGHKRRVVCKICAAPAEAT